MKRGVLMAHREDDLLPIRRRPRNLLERAGFDQRQQRRLDLALALVTLLLLGGWVYATVQALHAGRSPSMARQISGQPSLLAPGAPPPATFLVEQVIDRFTDWEAQFAGESGDVRIVLHEPGDSLILPDSVPAGVEVLFGPADTSTHTATADSLATTTPPRIPGIWNVLVRARDAVRRASDISVVTLVPAAEVRGGRIGRYRIGSWPDESGAYAPPRGFVQVTPENFDTPVSEHVRLGDFVTKGQDEVWPKYVALSPRALDKLELTIQELERRGHPVENIFVVSGFRTPWYNATGGDTQGRGALSRHMYGDAIDFAVDNDGDGRMDDLNGDGRVTVADARIIAEAAEEVERRFPELVGGIGVYAPTGAHAGFVHLDTRGYRARW